MRLFTSFLSLACFVILMVLIQLSHQEITLEIKRGIAGLFILHNGWTIIGIHAFVLGLILLGGYLLYRRQGFFGALFLSIACAAASLFLVFPLPRYTWWPLAFLAFPFIAIAVLSSLDRQKPVDKHTPPRDVLGRKLLYERHETELRELARRVPATGTLEGKCVALFGKWGSGKSHFIQDLKYQLSQPPEDKSEKPAPDTFSIIEVDLWACASIADVWNLLKNDIYTAITGYTPFTQGNFAHLCNFLLHLFPGNHLGTHEALKQLISFEGEMSAKDAIETLKRKLNYEHSSRGIVIILEDIDRAKPEIIIDLLPLIERLKKIPGVLVIVTVAFNELKQRLESAKFHNKQFQGYIDRLFDLSIEIPELDWEQSHKAFWGYYRSEYNISEETATFLAEHPLYFDSPRQIQRVAECLHKSASLYFSHSAKKSQHYLYINTPQGSYAPVIFMLEIMRSLMKPVYSDLFIQHTWNKTYTDIISLTGQLNEPEPLERIFKIQDAVKKLAKRSELPSGFKNYSDSRLLYCILDELLKSSNQSIIEKAIYGQHEQFFYITTAEGDTILQRCAGTNKQMFDFSTRLSFLFDRIIPNDQLADVIVAYLSRAIELCDSVPNITTFIRRTLIQESRIHPEVRARLTAPDFYIRFLSSILKQKPNRRLRKKFYRLILAYLSLFSMEESWKLITHFSNKNSRITLAIHLLSATRKLLPLTSIKEYRKKDQQKILLHFFRSEPRFADLHLRLYTQKWMQSVQKYPTSAPYGNYPPPPEKYLLLYGKRFRLFNDLQLMQWHDIAVRKKRIKLRRLIEDIQTERKNKALKEESKKKRQAYLNKLFSFHRHTGKN